MRRDRRVKDKGEDRGENDKKRGREEEVGNNEEKDKLSS
jgi:hypothetical protein